METNKKDDLPVLSSKFIGKGICTNVGCSPYE